MSEVHKFTFDGYPAVKLNGVPYVRADSLDAMGYVKVVRCKDCRFRDYGRLSDDGRPYCWQTAWYICDDFFCYMGEPGEPYGKKEAKPD